VGVVPRRRPVPGGQHHVGRTLAPPEASRGRHANTTANHTIGPQHSQRVRPPQCSGATSSTATQRDPAGRPRSGPATGAGGSCQLDHPLGVDCSPGSADTWRRAALVRTPVRPSERWSGRELRATPLPSASAATRARPARGASRPAPRPRRRSHPGTPMSSPRLVGLPVGAGRLTVGVSRMSTPLRRASAASSPPSRLTRGSSQVAASAVGEGRVTERSRSSQRSPRTSTGPSDRTHRPQADHLVSLGGPDARSGYQAHLGLEV
jgi:hypothetical protein